MQAILFSQLKLENWRQFQKVELSLHPKLTVITGANGAGKTTLLNIFSRHFGWHRNLLATPVRRKDGTFGYVIGVFSRLGSLMTRNSSETTIGEITYSNRKICDLAVPNAANVEYGITIKDEQNVAGLSIPSHRSTSRFQQVSNIPTTGIGPEQAYGSYLSELINKYNGGHSNFSPIYRMKEAIISMAMFGKGNEYAIGRPELLNAYLGFVSALRKMLPESLGFQDLSIRTPDVVVVTRSGEFLLDAASGGLSAIIDLTWQIYLFSLGKENFVVTIDEPENHLHPSMQRGLMRKLLLAFPQAQFIVATHSPFIVTSVRDSNVYVLTYDMKSNGSLVSEDQALAPERSVIALQLEAVNKSGTANEVLRDVLGLETTMPEWAEAELQNLVEQFQARGLTRESYIDLTRELRSRGLERLIPDVLDEMVAK